jgi:lipid II:glycine glycyltransferase (peptidoglycan interpeptide bridge formation enzyme)
VALQAHGAKGPVRVVELGPGERPQFDAFVGQHPQGSVVQSWTWGELRADQHWEPHRLLALDADGRPCGAALALCRQLPIGGSSLYVARGPIRD